MKKLALAVSLIVAAGFANVAYAKGGHGHGHGRGHHSFAMSHGHHYASPPGWSHGRKVGWRGRGCPPGLWKQGRC
ncbi:hypothetical protein IVA79_14470 [Bradyrhizobium sp. 138]|uniref:hypothetical protein n=1 Tax=Bradyrhizobium sp. 138 TaxID=2782615 RepID=UPI001FF8D513|nr:hypothetical protein [Bradyrhizobium sp. 138]MCK1735145.1 hypothetical protein [Bradyrhizobium sp. 138]